MPDLRGRVEQGASRYQRRLADVALGGRRMVIVLAGAAAALRCRRLRPADVRGAGSGLDGPLWAADPLLRGMLEEVAVALAGRAGARLARSLQAPPAGRPCCSSGGQALGEVVVAHARDVVDDRIVVEVF